MLDLIKLLDDAFATMRYGRGVLITWPASSMTGADMENILRQRGVRVYARQYARNAEDNYGLHVPVKQARYARYMVARALAGQQLPRPWGRGVGAIGLAGRLVSWIR